MSSLRKSGASAAAEALCRRMAQPSCGIGQPIDAPLIAAVAPRDVIRVRWRRHTGVVAAHPRYMDGRPVTVVRSLTDLAGPGRGPVRLPSSLEWSSDRVFDLGDDSDLRLLYETVLREARDGGDLERYLDAELLIGRWPRLWLPTQARRVWESTFSASTSR